MNGWKGHKDLKFRGYYKWPLPKNESLSTFFNLNQYALEQVIVWGDEVLPDYQFFREYNENADVIIGERQHNALIKFSEDNSGQIRRIDYYVELERGAVIFRFHANTYTPQSEQYIARILSSFHIESEQ